MRFLAGWCLHGAVLTHIQSACWFDPAVRTRWTGGRRVITRGATGMSRSSDAIAILNSNGKCSPTTSSFLLSVMRQSARADRAGADRRTDPIAQISRAQPSVSASTDLGARSSPRGGSGARHWVMLIEFLGDLRAGHTAVGWDEGRRGFDNASPHNPPELRRTGVGEAGAYLRGVTQLTCGDRYPAHVVMHDLRASEGAPRGGRSASRQGAKQSSGPILRQLQIEGASLHVRIVPTCGLVLGSSRNKIPRLAHKGSFPPSAARLV